MNIHRGSPARHPIELPLDASLVEDAAVLGIDLADTAEKAIREAVANEKARRWREENAEAIRANNAQVEREGLWCDEYRLF